MKWMRKALRKIRAGDGLAGHPLANETIDQAVKNISAPLVALLRRVDEAEKVYPYAASGETLRAAGATSKQLEALVKRALLRVDWNNVPNRAPIDVKAGIVSLTERGRALLAVWDIILDGKEREWAGDLNFTAGGGGGGAGGSPGGPGFPGHHGGVVVSVSSQGGQGGAGGGGAGQPGKAGAMTAAQVAQALNASLPGVMVSPAARGPVQKPQPIKTAAAFHAAFGLPQAVIVPPGANVSVIPGKKPV